MSVGLGACINYRIIRKGSVGFGDPSGFLFAYFYLFIFRVVIYSVSELCKNDKIDKKNKPLCGLQGVFRGKVCQRPAAGNQNLAAIIN